MANALIFNVNGRESTQGAADETLAAGAWDPGGPGTNTDYFPAIYTDDFTPGGTVGFFLGYWPDGSGGQDSAIKVNVGLLGSWTIGTPYIYDLVSGTPAAAPSDGIVIEGGSTPRIIVYENTEKRAEYGYLAAGVYGIKGYADDGTTMVFELSDDNISLAGWAFTNTTLSAANISFLSGANPLITVGADSDWKIEIGGTAGSEYIGSSTFSSGPLGQGWQIDSTTGRAEFQDVVARGKLSMAVFEYGTISAVGGFLLISPADVLAVDMTAADASTLTVDGDTTFQLNEILRMKDGTDDEWLQVTNVGSAPTYTVTRDLAGDYAANSNPIWTKGTAVVSTGVANGGYIVMDTSSANTPFLDVILRNSATYDDVIIKARLGNLDGIPDTDFGTAPSGFGLYTDNVYLKGSIVTSAGAGQRITINEYESGAFNNALIFYAAGGEVVRIDDNIFVGSKPGIKLTGPSAILIEAVAGDSQIYFQASTTKNDTTINIQSGARDVLWVEHTTYSGGYVHGGEHRSAIYGYWHNTVADPGAGIRSAVRGVTNISDAASNSIAVGIHGTATNAGSGAVWSGYFANNLFVAGSQDIIYTATEPDSHALEIEVNAAGFGDVKAIEINYITGAIVDGQDEGVILLNIDESLANGGEVFGLEVLATEGLANIWGLKAAALVGPIHQDSGVFVNMDSALVNAVDRRAEFISTVSDIPIFVAFNDTVTIGHATKYEEIEFLLATVASGGGIKPTFEYSTGASPTTWADFTPVDGTDGLKHNGIIAWDDSDIPLWAVDANSEYLIRIKRTRNSLGTNPIEDKVQIASTTTYEWTKDGDIFIRKLGVGTAIPQKDVHIESSIPTLRLSDSSAANDQEVAGLIEFYRGNNTNRVGYLAMDSASNNIMALATDYAAGILQFRTGNGVAAMTINASQNVGVGSATPGTFSSEGSQLRTLMISGNIRPQLLFDSTGSTQEARLLADGAGLYIDVVGHATATNNDITFRTTGVNSSFTPVEQMRIDSAGNVGIGLTTIDANYKLIVRRAADVNFGIGLQGSELALTAFNDAISANVPMRFYASEFNFINGKVSIGTDIPSALVHIAGDMSGNFGLKLQGAAANKKRAAMAFFDDANTEVARIITDTPNDDTRNLQISTQTGVTTGLIISPSGTIGINIAASLAQLHIDQASTTAAIPVLTLDQADVDKEFIALIGTAAAADLSRSLVDEGDQGSETRAGWLKIHVTDPGGQIGTGVYSVPFYTLSA